MKKLFAFIVMLPFIFGVNGCMDCVDGSGHITTETRQIKPFRKIELKIPAFVEVGEVSKTLIRINAQENILKLITTKVVGEKLVIDASRCIGSAEEIQIAVFTPSLEELQVKGSGIIKTKHPIVADKLKLEVKGSGKIFADTYANDVVAAIKGSAEIVVNGTTVKQKIKIEGSGYYNAMGLKAYETKINITGSGKAEVSSLNVLDVKIEGSGEVVYSGDPKISTKIEGSGTVYKMR